MEKNFDPGLMGYLEGELGMGDAIGRGAVVAQVGRLGVGHAGCSCRELRPLYGAAPPDFSCCYGSRLISELRWLHADVNDMVFGIDYYQDMNSEFGSSTYR